MGNVIWVVLSGAERALAHLAAGALLCLSVVGIQFGVAWVKLIPLVFVPFGKEIVPAGALPPGVDFRYGEAFAFCVTRSGGLS